MDYEQWKEEIREVPIEDICDTFGIERSGSQIICPAHNDRHFGSCKLYNNRFRCFACGASGDGAALLSYHNGLSWYDAAKEIAAAFGIGDIDSNTYTERMPISDDDIRIIGLIPGVQKLFFPNGETDIKPKNGVPYRNTADGYLTGTEEKVSLREMFLEDRDAFYFLVNNAFVNAVQKYADAYRNEIWKHPWFEGLDGQRALEYMLKELKKINQKLCAANHSFPNYQHLFPVFQKHGKRVKLVV